MPEDTNVEMAQISPIGSPIAPGEYSGMPAFPNGTPFFYDAPHINGLDLRGSDGESEHSTSDNGDDASSPTNGHQTEESESFNNVEPRSPNSAETNQTDVVLSHNSTEHSSISEIKNIEVSAEA